MGEQTKSKKIYSKGFSQLREVLCSHAKLDKSKSCHENSFEDLSLAQFLECLGCLGLYSMYFQREVKWLDISNLVLNKLHHKEDKL